MQPPQSSVPARTKTKIIIEYSDSTILDELTPNIHVLRGEVRFRHDGTLLFCDSAYFYNEDNSIEAFSNVRIEQGDSVFIYGDFLTYFGNVGLAQMRDNVRMENNEMTLFTDHLDFDRMLNLGYFFDGGLLVDSVNELTSVYGQYSPDTKMATFKTNVVLTNPQFVLKSDTLEYNTTDHVATILGPSTIESDSGFIYSSRGKFNTVTNHATLYDRSTVVTKDGTKTLTADTLFYNRETGFGEAFSNMVLNDTVKKMLLTGNYGYYDDPTDFAFAMEEKDTTCFNQMKGRLLTAFFTAGELTQIDVEGNTESIYYPIDEKDGSFISLTKTESKQLMTIYIENREPVKIWWRPEPTFNLLPLPDLQPEQKFLKDFIDFNYLRPKDKLDIFTKKDRKAEDIPAPRRRRKQ
ncbi:hypothetical protein FACS1894176_01960 [Bacteroidia bacterium]|nr:hypothetical protein FACS1894176_01960 [Bacteroidia bacterium]